MEYYEIVKKSLSNAWKYKFLWLFGFFVASVDNGRTSYDWVDKFNPKEFLSKNEELAHLINQLPFDINPYLIGYIFLSLIVIGFIFWIVSVFSEGALIVGISRKEVGLETSFSHCLNEGFSRFPRLFGIMLISAVFTISIVLALAIIIIPSFMISNIIGFIAIVGSFFVFIPILFVIICMEGWAIRYAVLFDTNWLGSISKAWELFSHHTGQTIGIAFSSFLTNIIISIGMGIGMIFLAIPFVVLGFINIWLGIIPGGLTLLTIIMLISAYLGVFASSVWTIGFMQLTGYAEPAP